MDDPLAQDDLDDICTRIGERAGHLFNGRRWWCSAAVLASLNGALRGDLSESQIVRLTAGFSEGVGGSGCLCGALAGGVLALGLLRGAERPSPSGDSQVMNLAGELHRRFKSAFGSTCCRVLVKKLEPGTTSLFRSCGMRTARAARFTAELILAADPGVSRCIDWSYVARRESVVSAQAEAVFDGIMHRVGLKR